MAIGITSLIGKGLSSTRSLFCRYQIVQINIANTLKFLFSSIMYFKKSKKVGKCFEYQKPHMRLESHTIEILGHSQTAWQTSSGNCLQCSQTSSVNNFRRTKLVLKNRALLQALQTKFHVLFGTLQP